MIKKKNLTLFEESYNEGYEQAIFDLLNMLIIKHPKNKKKYESVIEELYQSFNKPKETKNDKK